MNRENSNNPLKVLSCWRNVANDRQVLSLENRSGMGLFSIISLFSVNKEPKLKFRYVIL